MRRIGLLFALLCAHVALVATSCFGQTPQSYLNDTGSPAYGVTIPVENGFIDISNGNLHLEFPLATPPQRGALQLNERLVYDSRIWMFSSFGTHGSYHWWPYNVYGSSQSSGGWRFVKGNETGTVSYGLVSISYGTCYNFTEDEQLSVEYDSASISWTDPGGTAHPFNASSNGIDNPCTQQYSQNISGGIAADGSGYQVADDGSGNPVIIDNNGAQVYPGTIDRYGNYFSADSSSNLIADTGLTPVLVTQNGNVTYYDVLSANGTINNQGTRARYTVTSASVPVSTQFNQSDTYEWVTTGLLTPVQSIALPDGSQYTFSYDSYGELSQVTLPTGGSIQYGYANFLDSSNTENRWLTSRTAGSDPATTFTPSVITTCANYSTGCIEHVNVHKPSGDETVYELTLNNGAWNTGTTSYAGSATGNQQLAKTTSVNTYTNGCSDFLLCVGANYLSQSLVTTVLSPNTAAATKQTQSIYNPSNGQPSAVKEWDYFTGSPSPTPTRETDYVYSGFDVQQVTVLDRGNTAEQTTYGYTSTATATSGITQHLAGYTGPYLQSVSHWLNTGGSLTTTYTMEDTGEPLTSTDPNGTTHYGYDSIHALVTSTTPPTPSSGVALSSSASFQGATGLPLSQTDANGTKTGVISYDVFSRPTEVDVDDSLGNVVGKSTYNYSPTQLSALQYQNSSTYADTETQYDQFGRVSRTAVFNGQSGNVWYQQDTCYDTNGRVNFQSTPYQGNGWGTAKVCSGAGTATTYDGLDRVLTVVNADGTIQYSYNGRATQVTDVSGVSTITQADAFGRPTTVCEISSSQMQSDSPASCGTDIAGTGFSTTYTYDLANHKTTVQQGVQQRVFQTDSVGRTTFTTEPERGTTTYGYAYNATGLVMTRSRPTANQTNPSATTTTTTQYDALSRKVSVTYTDGTPNKTYSYDAPVAWPILNQQNTKGRLSLSFSSISPSVEATIYSYDARGRVAAMGKCQPSGCTNRALDKLLPYSYDWVGNVTSSSDGAGVTISNTYSPASEIQSITSSLNDAGDPGSLVSNVVNGPNGPTSYQMGNGITSVFTYDALGRKNGGWACRGSNQFECGGGTQLYGYLVARQGTRVVSTADTIENYAATYAYGDLNRMIGVSVGGSFQAPSFSYNYDRYGNRLSQNVTHGSAAPQPQLSFNTATNQINTGGFSYDAAGNMLSDGLNTYQYDAEGNMIASNSGLQYAYDAQNQQIRLTGGAQAEYVLDPWGKVVSLWETNSVNNATSQGSFELNGTAYWGSTPIESYSPPGSGISHFRYRDWTGSLRLETDGVGNVTLNRVNLPFGDGASNTSGGRDGSFDGFAGYYDGATAATNHAPFREYSNLAGRWMSPDPYDGSYNPGNPQSLNRYSYALNNPLTFTDPSGQYIPDCGDDYCEGGGDGGGGGGGDPCPVDACVTAPPPDPVDPGNPGQCVIGCTTTPPTSPGPYAPPGRTPPNAPNNQINMENGTYTLHVNVSTTAIAAPFCTTYPTVCAGAATAATDILFPFVVMGSLVMLQGDNTPASTRWSKFPGCSVQYQNDIAICQKRKTSSCWSSAAARLANCNATGGEVGSPPLSR